MGRAVSGSMPSALGLRAPKAQREWARPLSNWPPKLRRTVRLQRTRLPKPLSSWPRIVPVSFTGQSLPLMGGALLFEVCGRHDIQSAHWRPYEKHKRKYDSQRVGWGDNNRAANDTAGCVT